MKRREFIRLLGCAAVEWPLAARAQQPAVPVIGFLGGGSPVRVLHLIAAFRQGLKEAGYVEGQDVLIEYRWAENQHDRLPALAADLVHRQVKVIVATGGVPSWLAAKAATATIPIVLQGGDDPAKFGLVASLGRPGGNVTGVINISAEVTPKRLELLRELVPTATRIAFLTNPSNPNTEPQLMEVAAAAMTLHQNIEVVNASSDREMEEAFATVVRRHASAVLVAADPVFTNYREQLVTLAARHAVPAIYHFREYPAVGGLISYGTNLANEWRKTGTYAGRNLKGDKPKCLFCNQPNSSW
jgi:putative tryptophan/tyrosine transport system substrate-binding protein